MAGLAAEEFPLPREAVGERRCREEVGVGTPTEAAEAYRPESRRLERWVDRGRRPEVALLRQEVQLPYEHRPRALSKAALHLGLLHQAHAP